LDPGAFDVGVDCVKFIWREFDK